MTTNISTKKSLKLAQTQDVPSLVTEFSASGYSDEHTKYIALMDDYFEKVRAQEAMYVAAGFPADGLTDFLAKWFRAWELRSVVELRDCMTDDMVYADNTIGSRTWQASQTEYDIYHLVFRLIPDAVFYPQDDTAKALPLYDFYDGQVRLTVPWRVVGRPRLAFRTVDAVGVDRYNMVRDPVRGWLIARIDTDADNLFLLGQLLPLKVQAPKQVTVQRTLRLAQRAFPSLRGPKVHPTVYDTK